MRYVQLRAFHNVALHGGFSRAAEELHLTQPAISDQVRKLEEEYDVLLFNRLKKALPKWMEFIGLGFVPEELKERYRSLINERARRMDLSGSGG